jgi:hypothetical protein
MRILAALHVDETVVDCILDGEAEECSIFGLADSVAEISRGQGSLELEGALLTEYSTKGLFFDSVIPPTKTLLSSCWGLKALHLQIEGDDSACTSQIEPKSSTFQPSNHDSNFRSIMKVRDRLVTLILIKFPCIIDVTNTLSQ